MIDEINFKFKHTSIKIQLQKRSVALTS